MPMTAFLLQDIPADVADYASRMARSTRRDMNAVLVEMLARAAASPPMAPASAPALTPVPSSQVVPDPVALSTPVAAAPAATFRDDGSSESLALLEAMQAAQSIPSG